MASTECGDQEPYEILNRIGQEDVPFGALVSYCRAAGSDT